MFRLKNVRKVNGNANEESKSLAAASKINENISYKSA